MNLMYMFPENIAHFQRGQSHFHLERCGTVLEFKRNISCFSTPKKSV